MSLEYAPSQFKVRKFGGAILPPRKTMEPRQGRTSQTDSSRMLPQEVWLNRLIAMEETLPRGKF